MSRILKDSTVTLAAEIFTALTLFVNGVLIARIGGDDGKGLYTLAVGFGSLGALLFGFRWQRPTGYFLARDRAALPGIAGANLMMTGIATVVGFLLWWLAPAVIEKFFLRNFPAELIVVALALVATASLWQAVTAIYGGLREFYQRSIFLCAYALVGILPIVVLYAVGERDIGRYLIVQGVVNGVLCLVWFGVLLRRERCAPTIDRPLIGKMARYSAKTYPSLIADQAVTRLDMYLLNSIGGAGGLALAGVYSVAVGLSLQLGRIPTILSTVLFTRVAANEMGEGQATARIVRIALLAMIVAGLLLAAVGSLLIVPLYTSAFAGAIPALWVMVPATVFLGLFRILSSDLEGRGRPLVASSCSFAAAVVIVVLDLWWIPLYGVMGAAWASLIAYGVAFAGSSIAFSLVTGIPYASAFVPQREDYRLLVETARRLARRGRAAPPAASAARDADAPNPPG